MLFNSYEFIFAFLPMVFAGYYFAVRFFGTGAATAWLFICSLFFYAYWKPVYLVLLLFSIGANYTLSLQLCRGRESADGVLSAKMLLVFGVVMNLGLLAYFKYANFFVDNVNALTGTDYHLKTIILPLAISFFTFQQLAFLIDSYKGIVAKQQFIHYGLFVSFFPQLIAGPIVHHKEMMPQFADANRLKDWSTHISIALLYFAVGLFKKIVLADSAGAVSTPIFATAEETNAWIDFFTAWAAALGYTLQLYFDFSGYSDMAMGAARLFGIKLPLNFNAPYKSVNIVEFWRRWHMTLSRFLRDYLYIPLGGNRKGSVRRNINLMITMLLGGLWHGAGWTFVVWGGLHGLYLFINHSWQRFRKNVLGHDLTTSSWLGRAFAILLTLLAVIIGWVFFRATSFDAAMNILSGMFGFKGAVIPGVFSNISPVLNQVLELLHIKSMSGGGQIFVDRWFTILWIIPFAFLPTSHQLADAMESGRWKLGFNHRTAIFIALAFLISIVSLNKNSEFLYFQF